MSVTLYLADIYLLLPVLRGCVPLAIDVTHLTLYPADINVLLPVLRGCGRQTPIVTFPRSAQSWHIVFPDIKTFVLFYLQLRICSEQSCSSVLLISCYDLCIHCSCLL